MKRRMQGRKEERNEADGKMIMEGRKKKNDKRKKRETKGREKGAGKQTLGNGGKGEARKDETKEKMRKN